MPVIDKDGEPVGIVTEGDFLRRSALGTQRQRPKWLEFIVGPGKPAQEYTHSSGRKVEEIMTPDQRAISEDEALEAVVEAMERHHVKRVPQASWLPLGQRKIAASLSIATEFTIVLRAMAGSRSQATNKVGKNVSTTSGVNDAS